MHQCEHVMRCESAVDRVDATCSIFTKWVVADCITLNVRIVLLNALCPECDTRMEWVVGREQRGTSELVNDTFHILTILTTKIHSKPHGVGGQSMCLEVENMNLGSNRRKTAVWVFALFHFVNPSKKFFFWLDVFEK